MSSAQLPAAVQMLVKSREPKLVASKLSVAFGSVAVLEYIPKAAGRAAGIEGIADLVNRIKQPSRAESIGRFSFPRAGGHGL